MSTRKYLLDEHVNPVLRQAIHHRWFEIVVWRIGDPGAPSRGTPDPEILLWCEANGFTLITNNRTSMPVHLRSHLAAARHIPGIFILNNRMSISETAEELATIWWAAKPDEYVDLVTFLPVSY